MVFVILLLRTLKAANCLLFLENEPNARLYVSISLAQYFNLEDSM